MEKVYNRNIKYLIYCVPYYLLALFSITHLIKTDFRIITISKKHFEMKPF